MEDNRRDFLRKAGLATLGMAGGGSFFTGASSAPDRSGYRSVNSSNPKKGDTSLIGLYGPWAASLTKDDLPGFSYRREKWKDLVAWRETAKKRLTQRLAIPKIGDTPKVSIKEQYTYDGLLVEELSWRLPYGRPTEAILLKPRDSKNRLPGILAFHDHGGNKYFGKRKITRTSTGRHPLVVDHQRDYYEGFAWANEMARRGYVVLVSDAFSFASRRVMLKNVPEHLRDGLTDQNPENPANIRAYNDWAGEHEHVMAKSLFSAGTTWPGVFFAEDQKALDILCDREDVDEHRIGCGGLSGGGIRTAFMGGLDPRIKCAVCVGFMTTWKDLVMEKSFTHTWMTYVPVAPNELDFPEILGLRVPLPTLVLNNEDDSLFTLTEMKNADNILQEVYGKADAADHYRCSFYPGPHKFDKRMQEEAFDWFDRWLKG